MEWKPIKRAAYIFPIIVIGALIFGSINPIIPLWTLFGKPVFAQESYQIPNIIRLPIVTASTVRISPFPNNGHVPTTSDALAKSSIRSSSQIAKKTPNQLEEIRTGQHDGYCSIVFEFQNEIDFDGPFVTDSELRLKLKGTITELDKFSEYTNIHSWVQLNKGQ